MMQHYLKGIGIEKDITYLNIEEMLLKIREFNQFNLYTVDEYYCIQLFDLEVCANDEVSCNSEFQHKDLKKLLILALLDIAETVYNHTYDF